MEINYILKRTYLMADRISHLGVGFVPRSQPPRSPVLVTAATAACSTRYAGKRTGKEQEHAARIIPRSRTWEELSVPGSVADGGESKPAEGGADTPDRMVRDGDAPSSPLPPLCHHRSHTTSI